MKTKTMANKELKWWLRKMRKVNGWFFLVGPNLKKTPYLKNKLAYRYQEPLLQKLISRLVKKIFKG